MPDERRWTPRADIPGMRVVFEGAAGERVEADVLNVGSGGLFIRTEKPLAVGKRLSLEVQTVADMVAWSALGRVVWTRETGTTEGAPGMGVKLIDVDDAALGRRAGKERLDLGELGDERGLVHRRRQLWRTSVCASRSRGEQLPSVIDGMNGSPFL